MTWLALALAIITTTWLALATLGTLATLALVHAAPPEPARPACFGCNQTLRGMTHVDGMWLCTACIDELPRSADTDPPAEPEPNDLERALEQIRRIDAARYLSAAIHKYSPPPKPGDC